MPRPQKKYHLLYKTTNVVTNCYYVGIHSTNDPFDGYRGSGQRLKRSVAKYGDGNHVTEFLDCFTNREDLIKAEELAVNEELLNDPLCMNLVRGGIVKPLVETSEETRRRLSEAHKGRKVTWGDKISQGRKGIVFSQSHRENITKAQLGRKLTDEWKANISKAGKGRPANNKRAIFVDGVEYESLALASLMTGLKKSTIGKRVLSKNYLDTYFKDSPKIIG